MGPSDGPGVGGYLLRALSCGAPLYGGIVPGIDRIVMLLCGEENLARWCSFR
jgi:aspartyl-tRNA synthetase